MPCLASVSWQALFFFECPPELSVFLLVHLKISGWFGAFQSLHGDVRPSQAFHCASQRQGWLQKAPFDSVFPLSQECLC